MLTVFFPEGSIPFIRLYLKKSTNRQIRNNVSNFESPYKFLVTRVCANPPISGLNTSQSHCIRQLVDLWFFNRPNVLARKY